MLLSTDDPGYSVESVDTEDRKGALVYFHVSHIGPEVPGNLTFLVDSTHTDLFQVCGREFLSNMTRFSFNIHTISLMLKSSLSCVISSRS